MFKNGLAIAQFVTTILRIVAGLMGARTSSTRARSTSGRRTASTGSRRVSVSRIRRPLGRQVRTRR